MNVRPFFFIIFFFSSMLFTIHVVPVNAQPVINSGWAASPPTIDGQIDPANEWAAAGTGTHTWKIIHHGPGWGSCSEENPIIMHVMNDADNLYILLEIHDIDPYPPHIDAFFIYFDNTHDGLLSYKKEDALYFDPKYGFYDMIGPTNYGGPYDNIDDFLYFSDTFASIGGQSDGEAAGTQVMLEPCGTASAHDRVWYVEFSHPLCSGDMTGADICLTYGDTVGVQVKWEDEWGWTDPTECYWPDTNGIKVYNRPPADVSDWIDIIISAPRAAPGRQSPRGFVGGNVFAIDKLSILVPYFTGFIIAIATIIVISRIHKY